ncbi:hypothetical protein K7432_016192, partial [Basidiobolus ranarum]
EVEEYNGKVGPTEKKKCSFYDEISDFYNKTRFDSPKPSEVDDRVTPESEGKIDTPDTLPSSLSDFQNGSHGARVFDTMSPSTNIGCSISVPNTLNQAKPSGNSTARPKRPSDSVLTPLHNKLLRIQQEGFDSSIPPEKLLDEFRLLAEQRSSLSTPYGSPFPHKSKQRSHITGEGQMNTGSKEDVERFFSFYREQTLRMNTGAEKARENFRYTLEVIENLAKNFADKEHQYADRQDIMFENFVEALRKD